MRDAAPREDETDGAYWPGVADSLLAALMIVMLLAFGGLVLFALNPNRDEFKLIKLQRLYDALQQKSRALETENARLQAEVEQLRRDRPVPAPPIIELTDAQNENFELGKAQISATFSSELRERQFPRLRQIIDAHPTVDTLEIIGHTDDAPIGSTRGNLDGNLQSVASGSAPASILSAGSNADLGLMRSMAVAEEWRHWLDERRITLPHRIEVRCYSAASVIPPPNSALLPKKTRDQKARRIEIRFTQLKST